MRGGGGKGANTDGMRRDDETLDANAVSGYVTSGTPAHNASTASVCALYSRVSKKAKQVASLMRKGEGWLLFSLHSWSMEVH